MPTIRESREKAQQDGHGEVHTETESDSKHGHQHIAHYEHRLAALPVSQSSPGIAACVHEANRGISSKILYAGIIRRVKMAVYSRVVCGVIYEVEFITDQDRFVEIMKTLPRESFLLYDLEKPKYGS